VADPLGVGRECDRQAYLGELAPELSSDRVRGFGLDDLRSAPSQG
jgi:hypothetical protein